MPTGRGYVKINLAKQGSLYSPTQTNAQKITYCQQKYQETNTRPTHLGLQRVKCSGYFLVHHGLNPVGGTTLPETHSSPLKIRLPKTKGSFPKGRSVSFRGSQYLWWFITEPQRINWDSLNPYFFRTGRCGGGEFSAKIFLKHWYLQCFPAIMALKPLFLTKNHSTMMPPDWKDIGIYSD